METLTSRNPATGEIIQTIEQTPLESLQEILGRARQAQKQWALVPPKERMNYFLNVREYVLNNLDQIADLICLENGKPKFEAIVNDIIPALDLLTHYAKRAPKLLKNRSISMRLMKHKKSYLQFWPKGVVAVIAPWNYPFSIPFGEIALALMSGNAVVFKPSEVTPLTGLKLVEIFEQGCFPKHLLQAFVGGPAHGAALVQSDIDKIFFTGSVATGKKVMAAAAQRLTPVVLELGGKDPMVILPDAELDFATSAALWGAFSNSGQACASTERIIVHESMHDEFVATLSTKLKSLRHAKDLSKTDFGVATYEKQKTIYAEQLAEINPGNTTIAFGGKFSSDKTYLEPTIVTNPQGSNSAIESTKVYRDETFGPLVAVTKYKTIPEAIQKANDTRYGLLASVIGKDLALAEQVASQIEAGSVLINEVLYTHGLAETPWGGVKESGFGRVHSDIGFLEFVNVRHIHRDRWWFSVPFKSLWWFPYSEHQSKMFKLFAEVMFRRSLVRKLKALPHLLTELIQMIKNEKRI